MYKILRIVFSAIIFTLVHIAYGISWQYLLCFIAVLGLMIVCSEEGRNE
jgi:membrane protease YdiL (CAAX protease family)